MQLLVDMVMLGGTARTRDLLQLGHSKHVLALAVRDGDLIRIRQGHYSVGRQDDLGLSAYRVGGHLAGMSALIAHGVWVPRRSHPLEIAVRPHSRALRMPSDARRRLEPGAAIIHWDDERIVRSAPFAESVGAALRRVAARLTAGELFAAFESALSRRLLSRSESESLRALFTRTVDARFAPADRLSGSGAESLLHFWLLGIGVALTQQLSIPGVGDVDFVLGRWQIAEVDGAGYHSDRAEFERDRRRHAVASALGYRTLRFSARMVEDEFELVAAAILAAIARGDHLSS